MSFSKIEQNENIIFNLLESFPRRVNEDFQLYALPFESKDASGKTIMHYAIEKGHHLVMKRIFQCYPEIFLSNDAFGNLIDFAIEKDQTEALAILVESGFQVKEKSAVYRGFCDMIHHFSCPMLKAIKKGNSEAIRILHRANPQLLNRKEENPLIEAIEGTFQGRSEDVVETLLQLGATPPFQSPFFQELRLLRQEIGNKITALFGRKTLGKKCDFIRKHVYVFLKSDLVKTLLLDLQQLELEHMRQEREKSSRLLYQGNVY